METLVVQTGVRHGRFAELLRSHGDSFTVGRAFNNDLVLTDAHVAPQLLIFQKEEDVWTVTVLDHTNPVLLNGKPIGRRPARVNSGDQLNIGRTRLQLYSEDHPIEQTRKLRLVNWLSANPRSPALPIALLLLVPLLDSAHSYFSASTTLKLSEPALVALGSALVILIWAGIWAVAGRIIRHQHQMGMQIVVTAVASVFSTLLMIAVEYLGYPFHSLFVQEQLVWFVAFTTMAVLLCLNLTVATNIKRPGLVAAGVSGSIIGVILAISQIGQEEFMDSAYAQVSSLKPPVLGLFNGVSTDEYFDSVQSTIGKLEEQRNSDD